MPIQREKLTIFQKNASDFLIDRRRKHVPPDLDSFAKYLLEYTGEKPLVNTPKHRVSYALTTAERMLSSSTPLTDGYEVLQNAIEQMRYSADLESDTKFHFSHTD